MKRTKPLYILTLLAGMTALAWQAWAAEQTIRVEINKGTTIKLDGMVKSVVIADPTTADVQVVSPRLLFVHGKKVGDTSLVAVDAQDNTILDAVVEVTHNISKLQRTIKRVAPDADVEFKTVDGGLVVDGRAASVAESDQIKDVASAFIGQNEKMVNMMTSAGSDQVTLQVKIVEMARTDLKKLGVNLQHVLSPGGFGLQILQGSDITLDSDGVLDRGGATSTGILGTWTPGTGNTLRSWVDALETQGLANILAEPTLTTTSGKPANFLAGGEFPIPVKDGNGSITVQYKPFGVSLNFTPVVMSKNHMSILVAPEVSTISFDNPIEVSGIKNPIINTRKAQATVELGSGETFMLAGLLKNENSNSVNKFPGLGDVPVLGSLFRSQQFQNNQTELVILVTPYVVKPVAEHDKLRTPMDGFVPPNDLQRLLMGNLYQQEPLEQDENAPKLSGQGGFILE